MRYQEITSSSCGNTSSSEQSSSKKSRMIIPKGLNKLTYEIIENLNEWGDRYEIPKGKKIDKETLFKVSQELSDNNIAMLSISHGNNYIEAVEINASWMYSTDFRIMKYDNDGKVEENLIEDITNLKKEGYYLFKFGYCYEYQYYAAEFRRNNR